MYSVDTFGSHPNEGNDDCWTGLDFESLEEAEDCFQNPAKYFSHSDLRDAAYLMLNGDAEGAVANPAFKAPQDSENWQREHAMQAGMAFGCNGFNDAMGY